MNLRVRDVGLEKAVSFFKTNELVIKIAKARKDRYETNYECVNSISGLQPMVTFSDAHRPKFSGEYISSALAGGIMNVPAHVARIT
jgi:hypothetical protein